MAEGPRAGQPCELVILAMGKLGGREMNYHSDLDIVFLFEADGQTATSAVPASRPRQPTTTNQHFFSELGQRIIKVAGGLSPFGRLYEIDARLRPTGKSGALATLAGRAGPLLRARCRTTLGAAGPVQGPRGLWLAAGGQGGLGGRRPGGLRPPLASADADAVRQMRHRMEETAGAMSLKRGPGGIVDIEFLVQMLQLSTAAATRGSAARTRSPRSEALQRIDALPSEDFGFFTASYRFLRTVESRLQLMNSTARDRLPDDRTELAKLAHLLGSPSSDATLREFDRFTHETRSRFDRIFDAEGTASRAAELARRGRRSGIHHGGTENTEGERVRECEGCEGRQSKK